MQEFYDHFWKLLESGDVEAIERYLVQELTSADKEKRYEDYAAIASEMVSFEQARGEFSRAEQASNDLLLLLEELNQEQTDYFAMTLMYMGNGYRDEGKASEARRCYTRSEKILTELNDNDPLLAALRSSQGLLCLSEREYMDAGEYFRESNRLYESSGYERDPHYLANFAGLGEALFRGGDPGNAMAVYESARVKILETDGKGRAYAIICGNLAEICESMHDAVYAQKYRDMQEEALRLAETSEE